MIFSFLSQRRASLDDLPRLLELYADDSLGSQREVLSTSISSSYLSAFRKIDADPNHYLMVVNFQKEENAREHLVATCHLTLLPSLTFHGTLRLQIESVRVHSSYRGKGIGTQMIQWAIDYGKIHGAQLVQLTTNKKRPEALRFYKRFGFQATHEGMKLFIAIT